MVKGDMRAEFYDQLFSDLVDIYDLETVIVNIGTDRAVGDSLGPLVGSFLEVKGYDGIIYGTLEKPCHALNLYEFHEKIENEHKDNNIIAIDACVGVKERIGKIVVRYDTPISPGLGVGKKLPVMGNHSIIGIIGEAGGGMAAFNNVRLSFIIEMADLISDVIIDVRNYKKNIK